MGTFAEQNESNPRMARWRRWLLLLNPTTLRWFVGLVGTFLGALLLVVPHRFEAGYSTLVADVRLWGLVFVASGLGLLLVLSSRLSERWVFIAHLPVSLVFLGLAVALAPAGIWEESVALSVLAVGTVWAGFLPLQPRTGPFLGDLFSLVMGVVGVISGTLMFLTPLVTQSGSEPEQPWLWLLGLGWVVASLFLMRAHMQPGVDGGERRLAHGLSGLAFIVVGLAAGIPSEAWLDVVIHCGAGTVLLLLPELRQRLRRFDPLSLRIRLALVPAVAAIASLTITVALVTQQQEKQAEQQALQTLALQAESIALNVVDFIDLKAADVQDLAREAVPRMYGDPQPVVDACRAHSDFSGCLLINSQLQVLGRAGELPSESRLTPVFQGILEAPENMSTNVVELLLVETPEKTIPLLAAPVINSRNQFLGCLVAALDPRTLDRRIGRSTSDVLLSDGTGIPIARELPLASEAEETLDPSDSEDGTKRRLTVTATVPRNLGWLVEVRQLRSEALEGVQTGREMAFLLLLVMAVLAAWGGIWAALTVTRPLRALAEAVDELEVDRLDATWHPAKEGNVRELDRLSAAFDHLRQRLREQTREREQLALELQARAEMLADQDRRKDEFLAMLAHELRNPLGAISSTVFLLREKEGDDAEQDRRLATINRQIHHLSRMVDDLLDVSRITRGKVELRRKRLDLVPLVQDVVSDFSTSIESKNHRLQVDLPDEPVWTEADRTRFGQILGNLVSNAVKYTDPGGELRISLDTEAGEPHGYAVLSVEDSGRGLEKELIPHVFDLFAQGDQGLDRPDSGLGIGLTLVCQLAEMHGGSVRAESPGPGKGSTFTVRLPMAPPPQTETATELDEEEAPAFSRVLVVDDHVDAAEALAEILRHRGHAVQVAHDGHAAVQRTKEFGPDAVLVDIGLPGMDGYTVAQELRRDREDLLLIAVTGYGRDKDRQRARDSGFDHFLTKPLEIHELGDLLDRKKTPTLLD